MIFSVILVLALAAFVVVVLARLNPPRADVWLAVLFLTLIELLRLLPLGK